MGKYIDSEGFKIDFIPYEDEKKVIEFYRNKNIEEFKEFIENLPKKYDKEGCVYEEDDAIHIKALYHSLINDKKAKDLTLKALKIYEDKYFDKEIMFYIVYNLIKFYKRKKELEKLYSFILKIFFAELYDYDSDPIFGFGNDDKECYIVNEKSISIAMETVEWIENNLKIDDEQKKILNYIVYMSVENIELNKLNEVKKNKFFKRYIKAIWELRDYIDLQDIFGPLLKGIGWSYVNLNSKDNKEDIINYFINSGIEENIAKELVKLVSKK